MQRIAVIGLGKVGTLVATLLHDSFNVTALDAAGILPQQGFLKQEDIPLSELLKTRSVRLYKNHSTTKN